MAFMFSGSFQAGAAGAIMEIGAQDAGKPIQLAVGDTLKVRLKGNPSTGYAWEVAGIDKEILVPVGEPEFIPDRKTRGSGGTVTLRFKAVSHGETWLKLVHRRPFEKEMQPIHTFEIKVWVE